MEELEIKLYYAMKFAINENTIKYNVLNVLFDFEKNEEKKKLLFKLIHENN